MSAKLELLCEKLKSHFEDRLKSVKLALGELTIEVAAADYIGVMTALRDDPEFAFEELIDLCGVDYSTYGDGQWSGKRFAVVVHLLSIAKNSRLRVRVFADDDQFPSVDTVTGDRKSVV
jgi:NADH-quinone oxidoreductase subunit C